MKKVLTHNVEIELSIPIMVAYCARKQMIKLKELMNFMKKPPIITIGLAIYKNIKKTYG